MPIAIYLIVENSTARDNQKKKHKKKLQNIPTINTNKLFLLFCATHASHQHTRKKNRKKNNKNHTEKIYCIWWSVNPRRVYECVRCVCVCGYACIHNTLACADTHAHKQNTLLR